MDNLEGAVATGKSTDLFRCDHSGQAFAQALIEIDASLAGDSPENFIEDEHLHTLVVESLLHSLIDRASDHDDQKLQSRGQHLQQSRATALQIQSANDVLAV